MRLPLTATAIAAAGLLLCGSVCGRALCLELITAEEARLPNDDLSPRGIFRGPRIVVVSPAASAGLIRSPFDLRIRFESFGGATIAPETVLVTYQKAPAVDLTQRLQPFIGRDGIELAGAVVPPGEHRLRIDVADTAGRANSVTLPIRVAP